MIEDGSIYGVLAYLQANYPRAQHHFNESLAIAVPADSLNTVPMSFEGLAGVAAMRRQPARAARLMGAARRCMKRSRSPRPVVFASISFFFPRSCHAVEVLSTPCGYRGPKEELQHGAV
jgi:hypothetical protein